MSTPTTTAITIGDSERCPIVPTQNTLSGFASLGGALGVVASACVLAVIFAYKKDRIYARERIVVGLTVANALYSIMCIVPLSLNYPEPSCRSVVPAQHNHYMRMAWFAWKFAIVCYEIFIVAFSTFAMRSSNPIKSFSKRVEVFAHALCWIVALAVLIGACFTIRPIVTEWVLLDKDETHGLHLACDRACIILKYVKIVAILTQAWLCLFCVAIVMWLVMRFWVLRKLRQDWLLSYVSANKQWSKDFASIPKVKESLIRIQKENFEEVALPLERYVWVFIMFFPPAVMLGTSYCASHNTPTSTCDGPTEMVLSFRTLFTCVVYFMDPECRGQLRDFRTLLHKLSNRVCGCGTVTVPRKRVAWSQVSEKESAVVSSTDDGDEDDRDLYTDGDIVCTHASVGDMQRYHLLNDEGDIST
eukprot:m.67580 g.67580  ORF g.67580 m.67580 type:complete len:417 (-) comp23837_c0_seq1:81-1331(-)